MTNGYIVLTKGDSKLFQHAVEAIDLAKPIYFVDAENKTIYFGNKIALEDSNVVINASNDTITIDADGNATITTSGGSSHLYVHTLNFVVGETSEANIKLSFITTFGDLITDIDLQRGEDLPNEEPNPKWMLSKFKFISAHGFYRNDSNYYAISGVSSSSSSSFNILYITNDNTTVSVVESYEVDCSDIHSVVDDVRQLF